MIYFDSEKNAYGFEIPNYICSITDEEWADYAGTNKWDIIDGVFTDITDTPEYQQKEAQKRQADFENKFFNIEGYGWFRKVPKGYTSAVECLNLAFNNVSIMGKLPAETMIFYAQPDFTKPEECTEEWLIEHQTKNAEMSAQEFGAFYAGFSVAWNNTEHN